MISVKKGFNIRLSQCMNELCLKHSLLVCYCISFACA